MDPGTDSKGEPEDPGEWIASAFPSSSASPGEILDDFELVRFLARGGMGEVWEARQRSLGRRRVALKLLRGHAPHSRELEIFRREARAGSRGQHAGLVAVYAYGESERRAWIAMELVEGGRTLRDWIGERQALARLPDQHDREVAEIVAEIAEAVHALHEVGVIHRDLKPGNVLLTAERRIKVTDFGIARLMDETALTRDGAIPQTYAYASPEQVAGRRAEVDRTSDVFSLGVVLYELLVLRRPFGGDTALQVSQQILREEPPPLRSIRSRVARELALICGKALEKDRSARYATPAELAADLRRFLAHRPIAARAPGPVQHARKWVARHPWPSALIGVVGAAMIGIGILLERTIVAQRRSEEESRTSALVIRMMEDMFRRLHPDESRGTAVSIPEVLDLERARVIEDLVDAPRIQGRLMASLGTLYHGLSQWAEARSLLERAAPLLATTEDDPLLVLRIRYTLAESLRNAGDIEHAVELHREVLMDRVRTLGPDDPETLHSKNALGLALVDRGELGAARELHEATLADRIRVLGPEHADTIESRNDLAQVLLALGEEAEALRTFEEAATSARDLLGADHPFALLVAQNLAAAYGTCGRFQEARSALEALLPDLRRVLSTESRLTLTAMTNLADCYRWLGEHERSIDLQQETLELRIEALGETHVDTLTSRHNLALALGASGDAESMIGMERETLEILREVLGDSHVYTLEASNALGYALFHLRRYEEAAAELEPCLAARRIELGDDHRNTLTTLENLVRTFVALGDRASALPLAEELVQRSMAAGIDVEERAGLLEQVQSMR